MRAASCLHLFLAMLLIAGCGVEPTKPEADRGRGNSIPDPNDLPGRSSIFKDKPVERPTEEEIALPTYPRNEDLINVEIRNFSATRVGLDRRNISVGADAVVRYSLVIVSDTGVKNVFYEGIRCDPAEWRVYALGRADESWARTEGTKWKTVDQVGYNSIRYTLARDYLCEDTGLPVKSSQVAINKIMSSRAKRDTRNY